MGDREDRKRGRLGWVRLRKHEGRKERWRNGEKRREEGEREGKMEEVAS